MRAVRGGNSAVFRILALAAASVIGGAAARADIGPPISNPEPTGPIADNVFDYVGGIEILRTSNLYAGSDARAAFGFEAEFGETSHVLFADGGPVGAIDYIDFRTAAPVDLDFFQLYLADDSNTGSVNRGATSFNLLAGPKGGPLMSIATLALGEHYRDTYGTASGRSSILIGGNLAAQGVQDFRLELTRATELGPRILELAGIGRIAAVPEPSSLALIGLGAAGLVGVVWRKRLGRSDA